MTSLLGMSRKSNDFSCLASASLNTMDKNGDAASAATHD